MAVNNNLGAFPGLADMMKSLGSLTGLGGGLSTSLNGLNSDLAGQPLSPFDAAQVDAEMGVLSAIRDVPRWVKDERARIQFQNERFLISVANVQRLMPPIGEKATDATLKTLRHELSSISEAAGTNPSHNVANLEESIENYIEAQEDLAASTPEVHAPEDTSASQTEPSSDNNSGGSGLGLLATMTGVFIATKAMSSSKISLTKGGTAPAKAKPTTTVAKKPTPASPKNPTKTV